MVKTIASLWLGFLLLFPQVVRAQAQQAPFEIPTEAPSQGFPLSSEPEVEAPQEIGETGMERRIVQFSDFDLGLGETVKTVILIGGNARIRGRVIDDILVIGGNVACQKEAQVIGKVTVIWGEISGKEHLKAGQLKNTVNSYKEINGWQLIPESISLMMRPQSVWGMKRQASFGWSVLVFVTLTIVHALLVSAFSQQMENMAYVISRRAFGSTLLGIIVLIAVPCLMMVLVFSLIGIPLMLLFCSILLPMAIYGKTAIFLSMGNAIFPQQSGVVAAIVGYWIYRMATAIPYAYIDQLTFIVASTIGIGVCLRTGFGQKSIHTSRKTYPHQQFSRRRNIEHIASKDYAP